MRKRRSPRGQAMVEYSAINWLLVVALAMMCSVRIIPGAAAYGRPMSVIELFLTAFQIHFDTYMYSLTLPI